MKVTTISKKTFERLEKTKLSDNIRNTEADIIAIIFHLGVLNGYFEK